MSRFFSSLVVTVIGLASIPSLAASADDASFVVTRGRVVCLDVAGRPVDSLFACDETNPRFGLESREGKLYKFLPTDAMTPIFTDSRVRQRELQITGRLRNGDELEIIKVQSIKSGKLYDIYYFCELCNIKAYTPGLCPCCRNELEFRETPP